MDWTDGLTILAIVTGPVAAVLITRFFDRRHDKRRQQNEVLMSLMRTRGARLSGEHVGALNIIQLEFHGREPILAAYQRYIEHLGMPLPSVAEQHGFFIQREDRFLELIASIAHDLNYRFDKRNLERLSYVPQAWGDDESLQRANMLLLRQLLAGDRPLHVTTKPHQEHSPFPPPPE